MNFINNSFEKRFLYVHLIIFICSSFYWGSFESQIFRERSIFSQLFKICRVLFISCHRGKDDSQTIPAPRNGNERSSSLSHSTIHYSVAQLIGDVIGFCRTCVRFSVITTGLVEHIKWSRWAFVVIEFIILYTSSAMQVASLLHFQN